MELKRNITSKSSDKKSDRSVAFDQVGEYVCKVKALRHNPESDQFSESYFIDLEVVSGPSGVGGPDRFYSMFFNPNKYTNTKMADGRVFSGKMKRTKDEESVQVALAACHGLSEDEAGKLADMFDTLEAGYTDSQAIGNLVDVVVTSSQAKRGPNAGKTFFNPKLMPHKQRPAVMAVPELPGKKPLPTGWRVHPENEDYAFNTVTNDVKLIGELTK